MVLCDFPVVPLFLFFLSVGKKVLKTKRGPGAGVGACNPNYSGAAKEGAQVQGQMVQNKKAWGCSSTILGSILCIANNKCLKTF